MLGKVSIFLGIEKYDHLISFTPPQLFSFTRIFFSPIDSVLGSIAVPLGMVTITLLLLRFCFEHWRILKMWKAHWLFVVLSLGEFSDERKSKIGHLQGQN